MINDLRIDLEGVSGRKLISGKAIKFVGVRRGPVRIPGYLAIACSSSMWFCKLTGRKRKRGTQC